MKALVIAVVVAAAGFGVWKFAHREPPDITLDQAKDLAAEGLKKICGKPQFVCSDFALAAQETPNDKRFKWAFRYENPKPDPAQRIVVSVGRKGDKSVEFTPFTVAARKQTAVAAAAGTVKPGAVASIAAPPAAVQGAVASLPAQAPPALSWTICELPPLGP